MKPDGVRLPTPADLAAALREAQNERLVRPEELARLTARQRRLAVPQVLRMARRAGRPR